MSHSIEAGIRHLISQNNHNIKIAFPAIVVGVEKLSDGFIDVKPIVNHINNLTGDSESYPTIFNVRVIFPSSNKSTICFPINQGDFVDLIVQSVDTHKFVNGLKEQHDPYMLAFGNLSNIVAFVGFSPYQDSCFNPNNYSTEFNNQDLNIVHNKNTDNESSISINTDGVITLRSPTVVKVEAKEVDVMADTINANNATISTNGDVLVQGQSVNRFMKSHTHIDSQGNPTLPPTPLS